MKMTNDQVINLYALLSKLNLRKFDKEIRADIYKNTVELQMSVKTTQDKINESKKEIFKDLEKEIEIVNSLREDFRKSETSSLRKSEIMKEIEKYDKLLSAENDFEDVLKKFGNDEVELNLIQIDLDKFIDGLSENDVDFNFHQLQAIAFLFK